MNFYEYKISKKTAEFNVEKNNCRRYQEAEIL